MPVTMTIEEYVNLTILHAKHNTVDDGNGNRQFCFCDDCNRYRMTQITNQVLADNPAFIEISKMSDAEVSEARQVMLDQYRRRITQVREMQETLTRMLGEDGAKELLALIAKRGAGGCDDPNCVDCNDQSKDKVRGIINREISVEEPEWRPGMYL